MNDTKQSAKLDILHGSIWNKLPRYALPVAATGILEQLFNASDLAVVGNFANSDRTVATAAVGANSPIIGVILNLFIGISLGTNVVIANAIGRKDEKASRQAVQTSILAALLGGLLVTLLGELIIGNVLKLLLVPADVFPYALMYIRIYLLSPDSTDRSACRYPECGFQLCQRGDTVCHQQPRNCCHRCFQCRFEY